MQYQIDPTAGQKKMHFVMQSKDVQVLRGLTAEEAKRLRDAGLVKKHKAKKYWLWALAPAPILRAALRRVPVLIPHIDAVNSTSIGLSSTCAMQEARYHAERREREQNAEGCHSEAEWQELLTKYGNRCLRCGIPAEHTRYGKLTKDHVVPLAKGGTDYASNLQPLCGICNSSNGDKEIDFRTIWERKNAA